MSLSKEEKNILLHTTGLSNSNDNYRNHFCADEGHADLKTLESLVEKGLMKRRLDPFNEMSKTYIYWCTAEGIEEARKVEDLGF